MQSIALAAVTVAFYRGRNHAGTHLYCASRSLGSKSFRVRLRLTAPAQHVVEEIVRVYPIGFGNDLSIFQGPPSPPVDEAWEDLYQNGILRIPHHEAALLPNRTSGIPGDPGYHIAELDLFHQLHCLNTIRKALHPVYYPEWDITKGGYPQDHITHCVEWLRHSIMCHSDTSVVVWQWNTELNQTSPNTTIPHTCRNFEPIQEWSRQNSLTGKMDLKVHVPDDLPASHP
ncbi:hypothetical protein C8R46DRAFT_1019907 [Mycena filopes]|nr:hypothetical protein C8R46DRAFT_1019907 [Mycena filopes]